MTLDNKNHNQSFKKEKSEIKLNTELQLNLVYRFLFYAIEIVCDVLNCIINCHVVIYNHIKHGSMIHFGLQVFISCHIN